MQSVREELAEFYREEDITTTADIRRTKEILRREGLDQVCYTVGPREGAVPYRWRGYCLLAVDKSGPPGDCWAEEHSLPRMSAPSR